MEGSADRKNTIANDIHPSSICEIGCGAGEILRSLKNYLGENVKYSGYEISPQAFEICEQKEAENLEFHFKNLLEGYYPPYTRWKIETSASCTTCA